MRKEAAIEIGRVFGEHRRHFALVTNTLAKDKEIEDRWRHYPRPVSSRNLANQVEDEVVDALVVGGARQLRRSLASLLPSQGEMVRRRPARLLGPQRAAARRCGPPGHLAAGAPGSCSRPMRVSRPILRRSACVSSKAAGSTCRRGPASRPARSRIRRCRRRIPICCSTSHGKTRDVMTLAHELGHGVHQLLAAPQGPLLSDTPLTLAETASVFGEMLTFQSLLASETDPKRRRSPARGQDRGHAEHGRAPDRLPRIRDARA